MLADVHMKSAMERAVRKRIMEKAPDVVVSVHPLMTNVPVLACRNITKETGKHLPIFTVCTDLGSAHSMWFANGVEKLFVASEAIQELAMQRGKVPLEKIVMSGLPIRNDFSVQALKMGERHCEVGRLYQKQVRVELELEENQILVELKKARKGKSANMHMNMTINQIMFLSCSVRRKAMSGDFESSQCALSISSGIEGRYRPFVNRLNYITIEIDPHNIHNTNPTLLRSTILYSFLPNHPFLLIFLCIGRYDRIKAMSGDLESSH